MGTLDFGDNVMYRTFDIPILNDDERHQVGLRYRESGSEAATALGFRLLAGGKQFDRIKAWQNHLLSSSNAALYCFRGGYRSRIACDWLQASGSPSPRILGGYKALRKHLLNVFRNLPPLVIVSGKTGTGKTAFLSQFRHAIDLEGIANHRGSAFGGHISPQPCQIDFENRVAIAFLKMRSEAEVLVEDEGRLIGRICLPLPLQQKMKQSPILVIEEPVVVRTERIFQEYIVNQWQSYLAHFEFEAEAEFKLYLVDAVDAIQKRLGGVAHGQIRQQMINACQYHSRRHSLELHRVWITTLLTDYYDPMYDYQMDKKSARIRARESRQALVEWYSDKTGKLR